LFNINVLANLYQRKILINNSNDKSPENIRKRGFRARRRKKINKKTELKTLIPWGQQGFGGKNSLDRFNSWYNNFFFKFLADPRSAKS
jgi:hypothetical protein